MAAPARGTGGPAGVRYDPAGIREAIAALDRPCYFVRSDRGVGSVNELAHDSLSGAEVLAAVPPLPPGRLGSAAFQQTHRVRYSYMAGSMANGIASTQLVVALVRAGFLSSLGTAGLAPERIERELDTLAGELPEGTFAANLIHSPHEPELERAAVELFLRYRVRCIEASAFMELTPFVVWYRLAGLRRDSGGRLVADNRVIAKVSRAEVADRFMRPAAAPLVAELVARGLVTREQAELARQVAMADDLTVEADSAGHTDRRQLAVALPAMLSLRDRIQRESPDLAAPRIGAAGGIGTPTATLAAFVLGADYVVTGSINQACVEAGTSDAVKAMLARAGVADMATAPAADMFEIGAEVQVLKHGTLFASRARLLRELYQTYGGIADLPAGERQRLEGQLFRRSLEDVWDETVRYFQRRDPGQIRRAERSPKRRMALIFRWYLGMTSSWAVTGDASRTGDFQIWCGPAMGGFNDWVAGSYLADPGHRQVADVAVALMHGAAYSGRVTALRLAGVRLPASCSVAPAPAATAPGAGATPREVVRPVASGSRTRSWR